MSSPDRPRHRHRISVAITVAGSAAVWLAATGTAAAHIRADPPTAEAGRTTIVGFDVEHGCNGSPTVEVAFAVPAGLGSVTGVAKAGWTVSNDTTSVTFRGGELPATQPGRFELSVTPTGGARTVHLPIVQRCREGELRWISITEPGAPEPAYPAPALQITASTTGGAVPTVSTAVAAATTGPTAATNAAPATTAHTHDDAHDDGHDEGESATVSGPAVAPEGRSTALLVVGGVVLVVATLIAVGWTVWRGRSGRQA